MDFAFLIHARDHTDIQKKYKIVKYLPKKIVEFGCFHCPPFVVKKIFSLRSRKTHEKIKGWLIGIPMTAEQILKNRHQAQKKIQQAINKAEKLGAKIVGLGALTSPITNGGLDLTGKTPLKITTGNALTASISIEHISEIIKNRPSVRKIAVIGGTGSIGTAISKILLIKFPKKELLIFGRTRDNMDNLSKELKQISPAAKINCYLNNLEMVKTADLVVIATSASGAIINGTHLKNGCVVYDITQPKNINKKTIKERPDVTFFEGGLVEIPELEEKLPLGLPAKTVFACLAETILLSLEDYPNDFSLGKVEIKKIDFIEKLRKKYNFKPILLNISN